MLTRVYIDNFRSFVNFEYRPESKQLLLGPNGSGKSSLLEAIRYLKLFVKGVENPFTQSTRTRWQDLPHQVIEIEASLKGRQFEYRVEVGFAEVTKAQTVTLERLKVAGITVFELAERQIRFFQADGSSTSIPMQTSQSALHFSQFSNPDVNAFVEWLGRVHCFDIDPYPGTMDEMADSEESEPDFELDNFAPWYRYVVQTFPEENVRFIDSLKIAMDGFQALRFLSSAEDGVRKLRAEFLAPTNKRVSYSLPELSLGQRYLIGLYAVLHFCINRGGTIFIDEPDNFIALREIQPWLLAAEEAAEESHGQLILISHHPESLNLWAKDYGLRFFRETGGHVRTEKFKPDPYLQPSELIARGWE
jgi:predicted ATPase